MISLNCIFKVAVLPQVALYIKNLLCAWPAVLQAHNGAPVKIAHTGLDGSEVSLPCAVSALSMLALTILIDERVIFCIPVGAPWLFHVSTNVTTTKNVCVNIY
jgi:hypothetical protein